MKRIVYVVCCSLLLCQPIVLGSNLSDLFDELMGKCTNPFYSACVNNQSKEPWFPDSRYAYDFARSLFEKYSIEMNWEKKDLKISRIIHQIWLGGGIPKKYAAWRASWPKYNPDWLYILWTDEDVKYLTLKNNDLFKKARNYAEKADILRLELMNIFGGLYVDTDYECLKSMDPFHYCHSFYISGMSIGYCGFAMNNALIGASRGHPLIQKMVNTMKGSAHLKLLSERSGPMYVTRTFFQNSALCSKDAVIYPPQYLSPNPDNARDDSKAYAIHWFEGSWIKPRDINGRESCKHSKLEGVFTPLYLAKKKNIQLNKDVKDLSDLLFTLPIKTIVELGACQFLVDFMEISSAISYKALSPVKFLVLNHRIRHSEENRSYFWKDWLQEPIPAADLLIIGDVMGYLPYKDCCDLFEKIIEQEPKFFIIAHDATKKNSDTPLGKWRALNMCASPFNLPKPEKIISVCGNTYGIWKR